ncbi:uncharacterized protein KY384_008758 [Bacidia gigantensis]|uniref:uncharacterized protein n=1 Tax=Bacidia gigantensis TaxID=2732470 RepID=UPI001D05BE6A|nr:uncharacterized protein KY384_008758 [Bacidia gigantensis]KAG8526557.1 hypothetical protein KY384_008758 [Bacidia gigantensis]
MSESPLLGQNPGEYESHVQPFLDHLKRSSNTVKKQFDKAEGRNLFETSCEVDNFRVGIGEDILGSCLPEIEAAQHEVVIVTCFWAKSASQQNLAASLQKLADQAKSAKRLVSVKLCFSSLSLWQKLTHTSSVNGQTYPSHTWRSTFGLPQETDLVTTGPDGAIGVKLSIKSIFVRPFSVMHPKFIIIDRQRAFLPSCNVSWENWFEGCVNLRGSVVAYFLRCYSQFWEQGDDVNRVDDAAVNGHSTDRGIQSGSLGQEHQSVPTLFLPSPHSSNPYFRPTFFLTAPEPPPTPLNIFMLTSFANAKRSIYLQTPNLTSPPVLSALVSALERGVDIDIITSSRMMLLEQLLTAGTTTEICVGSLIRRYQKLVRTHLTLMNRPESIEEGLSRPGRLSIKYYKPQTSTSGKINEKEPVKSHLKLTIIEDYVVVLGSGNMDRASWYTSQELGIAFFSFEMAHRVRGEVRKWLEDGRLGKELVKSDKALLRP